MSSYPPKADARSSSANGGLQSKRESLIWFSFFIFNMEEFVVYVLYSEKYKIHYTGFTSDLISRFRSHNLLSNKGFTRKYRPWLVVYVEFFDNKKDAIQREK
ncbi:GIY-YIG nuclease family protein [Frigoriflavimonas asaccharolytica]|uniref:Putative endonuclease n=1 Tax=Frigoriflavimonas asaccharolytica TaxID=2735899 RepID=A0A8J8K8B9_9FLAO|nr:GIY-YIG nuclease family protein [Frigoriflavimonas asaccharolytica]NRS92853.1 putative endonuclease [Frigoriflavimonas asaccharolytica]